MNCPFCGKEMREGFIPVSRNTLVWRGKSIENSALCDDVILSNFPLIRLQETDAFYCPDCRQVIIPVPEFEPFSDKVKRKLDNVVEKITSATQSFEEQREEKQKQKEQKKREGKDPWEL